MEGRKIALSGSCTCVVVAHIRNLLRMRVEGLLGFILGFR